MRHISNLSNKDIVVGLPKVKYEKDHVCEACQRGRQIRTSFQSKEYVSSTRPLQLIHMDLFDPIRAPSLGGKFYKFVIVDDYSCFTGVYFLTNKVIVFSLSKFCCNRVENEKGS